VTGFWSCLAEDSADRVSAAISVSPHVATQLVEFGRSTTRSTSFARSDDCKPVGTAATQVGDFGTHELMRSASMPLARHFFLASSFCRVFRVTSRRFHRLVERRRRKSVGRKARASKVSAEFINSCLNESKEEVASLSLAPTNAYCVRAWRRLSLGICSAVKAKMRESGFTAYVRIVGVFLGELLVKMQRFLQELLPHGILVRFFRQPFLRKLGVHVIDDRAGEPRTLVGLLGQESQARIGPGAKDAERQHR
jgi:hypothetical protein